MGGELGNQTYIDLLESSALFPPNFTLIGKDDIYTNLLWKIWCFEFSRISRRDRVGKEKKKKMIFFIYFFVKVQCCVRVRASIFQVLTRNSGGDRALGNIFRFLAGPARMVVRSISSTFHRRRISNSRTPGVRMSSAHVRPRHKTG